MITVKHYRALVYILSLFTLGGCGLLTNPQPDDRVLFENDETVLEERVTYTSQVIPIDPVEALGKGLGAAVADTVLLTLVAEVAPPSHDGITLQAADIVVKGTRAYVAYNVAGETFLGAVDVYNIARPDRPRLLSSALFTDTDINGIAVEDNSLYLAAATERADFDSPAILERITLQAGRLTDEIAAIDLPSFAATDVDVAGSWIYVTSGALGGQVSILDKSTFTSRDAVAVEDARGVDTDAGDVAVVAGTPARLLTFDRTLGTLVHDYSLDGATIAFSKSTVEVKQGKAVAALGDGGTQIICLETGAVLETVAQPQVSDLDPAVTVTNAATAYKRTLFMANGEGGVYVAVAASNFNGSDCAVDGLRVLGRLRFDDLQSVNHVAYRQDMLFIASGLGGLKIVTVEVNNDTPDDDDAN